mmetsp:Transcript_52390/g.109172  ORF Transcript_52390/g.109172 Transcript_52390/m.109172 type:complete len:105 (-) Transcript_52390:141-455(-)
MRGARSPRAQRRAARAQVDGTERLKKARNIRQPWLRDLLEGLWIARRTFLGITSVLVALGLWLAQHEGHLTEFAWILASVLGWVLVFLGCTYLDLPRETSEPLE